MKNRQSPAALLAFIAAVAYSFIPCFARASPPSASPADAGVLSPHTGSPQRRAAVSGLAALVARLPESASGATGIRRIFGIVDDRTLEHATIGEGFETYFIDPKALLAGKLLGDSLYGSNEWRFIVMANGEGVGLITVAPVNGAWIMVEAGANALARETASVAARYEQQTPKPALRFVRSPQAVADFIEVRPAGTTDAKSKGIQPAYVPLMSARSTVADVAAPAAALSDAQLDDALRQSVRRGMRDIRVGH